MKWSTKYQTSAEQGAKSDASAWFSKAAEQASAALFETPIPDTPESISTPIESSPVSIGQARSDPDLSAGDSWTSVENDTHSLSSIQTSEHGIQDYERPLALEICLDTGSGMAEGTNLASNSPSELADQPPSHNSEEAHRHSHSSALSPLSSSDTGQHLARSHLENTDTMLLQYYLTTVCDINSCFDSVKNPFRTELINQIFDSPLLYHSILSMSAAHMAGRKLEILPKAVEHQSNAIQNLRGAVSQTLSARSKGDFVEQALLASIILGMTSVGVPVSIG